MFLLGDANLSLSVFYVLSSEASYTIPFEWQSPSVHSFQNFHSPIEHAKETPPPCGYQIQDDGFIVPMIKCGALICPTGMEPQPIGL